ncbi:hypothetical protein [Streptomyces sp. NPDC097619]|uniref:hypothetical protein n=1 Tax=Streptomyces sp. NPDC097619 TaxID=3157228 RepID=UPI00332E9A09
MSRHVARGLLGFGFLGGGVALALTYGPIGLLLVPLGLVALKGCPMCWTAGLIEHLSRGRYHRTCTQDGCTLTAREGAAPAGSRVPGA